MQIGDKIEIRVGDVMLHSKRCVSSFHGSCGCRKINKPLSMIIKKGLHAIFGGKDRFSGRIFQEHHDTELTGYRFSCVLA